MVISWQSPDDGATQITSYVIRIAISDTVTFIEDLIYCDGSN